MYSFEERIRAVELYVKYGRKAAAVVRELGYPSRKNLIRWVRAWEASGELTGKKWRVSRYNIERQGEFTSRLRLNGIQTGWEMATGRCG